MYRGPVKLESEQRPGPVSSSQIGSESDQLFSRVRFQLTVSNPMATLDQQLLLLVLFIVVSSAVATDNAVTGCGGFVQASSSLIKSRKPSDPKLDYSHITVELRTLDGFVKDSTQCAPNGYYFIPVYDKGSFLLHVKGPDGWSWDPPEAPITVDHNGCNADQDINFQFTGFSLSGRVFGAVGGESCTSKNTGPSDVILHPRRKMNSIALALTPITICTAVILRFVFFVIAARRRRRKAVAFFHPYTNDGGGGERVLWCAVKSIQEDYPDLDVVVYTGDHDATSETLASRAVDRFGVKLIFPPKAVHLRKRKWIEEGTYPRFTMIGQSLGSVYLGWEALCNFTPLYFFDTSGYAFTYPVARLFGCKVLCYTHYPTISLDMLARVRGRSAMYNNDATIAKSSWLSQCKVFYYMFFGWLYGIVGAYAHLAMVNSSWTRSHTEKLWKIPNRIKRVYPPCDTSGLQAPPLERSYEVAKIISVAQFRPEKAHNLQLEAFAVAIEKLDTNMTLTPKLQFVGSCRNAGDKSRLQFLKDRAVQLKIKEYVEFHENLLYMDLVQLLGNAIVGIHSMIDEHFGICVVEYMAAGAIPIAHNSAGPRMDIVLEEDGEATGFLVQTVDEYADAILEVINMPANQRLKMAAAARKRAGRFSEQRFYEDFKAAARPVFDHASR